MIKKFIFALLVIIFIAGSVIAVKNSEKSEELKDIKKEEIKELTYEQLKGSLYEEKDYKIYLEENSKAIITRNIEGTTEISIVGRGSILTKETKIENIKDAKISLNKEVVEKAEFTATKNQIYEFDYFGTKTQIGAIDGSKINYNQKERKLSGEAVNSIKYGDKKIYMKNDETHSTNQFELKFDEKKKDISELSLPAAGVYSHGEKGDEISYTSEDNFKVYLDGRDIEEAKGNFVSISNILIKAKGAIKINDDYYSISYEGKGEVYTEYGFNREKPVFSISNGDVTINNGLRSIKIENGQEYYFNGKGDASEFSYKYNDGRNKKSYTKIESNGDVFGFNDKADNAVIINQYSRFQEAIGKNQEREQETQAEIINKNIRMVKEEINRLKEENKNVPPELAKKLENLEFSGLQTEIIELIQSKNEDDIKEARRKLNYYISSLEGMPKEDNPIEREIIMRALRTELYKNTEHKGLVYEDNYIIEEKLKELQKDPQKKDGATKNLIQYYISQKNLKDVENELRELINSENKRTASKAYLSLASLQAERGQMESALLNTKKAVDSDPQNREAKKIFENLQISSLRIINSGYSEKFANLYKNFEDKWGVEDTRNTIISKVGSGFSNTASLITVELGVTDKTLAALSEEDRKQAPIILGNTILTRLAARGYSLEGYTKANYKEQKEIIANALEIEGRDVKEINEQLKGKSDEEREKIIAEYSKKEEFVRDIVSATGSAGKNWDTALAISAGNPEKARSILKEYGLSDKEIAEMSKYSKFDFNVINEKGRVRNYGDTESIKATISDEIRNGINAKNAMLLLAPTAAARIIATTARGAAALETVTVLEKEVTLGRLWGSNYMIENLPSVTKGLELGTKIGFGIQIVEVAGDVARSAVPEGLKQPAVFLAEQATNLIGIEGKGINAVAGKILQLDDGRIVRTLIVHKGEAESVIKKLAGNEIMEKEGIILLKGKAHVVIEEGEDYSGGLERKILQEFTPEQLAKETELQANNLPGTRLSERSKYQFTTTNGPTTINSATRFQDVRVVYKTENTFPDGPTEFKLKLAPKFGENGAIVVDIPRENIPQPGTPGNIFFRKPQQDVEPLIKNLITTKELRDAKIEEINELFTKKGLRSYSEYTEVELSDLLKHDIPKKYGKDFADKADQLIQSLTAKSEELKKAAFEFEGTGAINLKNEFNLEKPLFMMDNSKQIETAENLAEKIKTSKIRNFPYSVNYNYEQLSPSMGHPHPRLPIYTGNQEFDNELMPFGQLR